MQNFEQPQNLSSGISFKKVLLIGCGSCFIICLLLFGGHSSWSCQPVD